MDTKEINNLIDLLKEEDRYRKAFNKQIQLLESDQPMLYPNCYPYLKALACRLIELRKQIDKNLEQVSLDFYLSAK